MAVVAAETCWSLDDYKSQRRLFPLYNINFFFLSLPPLQWPYIRQVRKDEHNKPLVLSTETLDDGEGEETVTERFDSSFCCMSSSSSSLNLFFFSLYFIRSSLSNSIRGPQKSGISDDNMEMDEHATNVGPSQTTTSMTSRARYVRLSVNFSGEGVGGFLSLSALFSFRVEHFVVSYSLLSAAFYIWQLVALH